jgi:hypothetical protein
MRPPGPRARRPPKRFRTVTRAWSPPGGCGLWRSPVSASGAAAPEWTGPLRERPRRWSADRVQGRRRPAWPAYGPRRCCARPAPGWPDCASHGSGRRPRSRSPRRHPRARSPRRRSRHHRARKPRRPGRESMRRSEPIGASPGARRSGPRRAWPQSRSARSHAWCRSHPATASARCRTAAGPRSCRRRCEA